MNLTYEEVEALKAKGDVYELKPGEKYLIVFRRDVISNAQLEGLTQILHKHGISGTLLVLPDPEGLKIFGMSGE